MQHDENKSEYARLVALREEHSRLDCLIAELDAAPSPDRLQITRLKKQKLSLKDAIAQIEDRLRPDIIA
ncbi:MAG: DUF465 domain-containing protein [Pseudomonadota bacterium]